MRNGKMVTVFSFIDAVAVLVLCWNYTGRLVAGLIPAALIFLIKANVFETTGKIKESLKELLFYFLVVGAIVLTIGMLEFKWHVKLTSISYFLLQIFILTKIKFGKR